MWDFPLFEHEAASYILQIVEIVLQTPRAADGQEERAARQQLQHALELLVAQTNTVFHLMSRLAFDLLTML